MASPEVLGRPWIIVRDPENATLAGRYKSRLGAEMVARVMSRRDPDVFFCVQAEDNGELVAMYLGGKRNEL